MERLQGALVFVLVMFFLTACGGGGGGGGSTGGPGPTGGGTISIDGTWSLTETAKPSNCAVPAPAASFDLVIVQNGGSISVTDEEGNVFNGSLSGSTLSWSGSYNDPAPDATPGRTTVNSISLNFDASCNNATGSADWTWSATDGSGYSCAGTTSFTASRSPAGDCGLIVAPTAPSALNAVATSSGSIDLSWIDYSDNEERFTVERSDVSASSGFIDIASLPADTQAYADTGLSPSTTYYYRVAAVNSSGLSDFSAVASATTDAAPLVPPAAPSDLGGMVLSSTSVSLTWTSNSSNESGFKVGSSTNPGGPYSEAAIVSANVVTATISGLTPGTGYYFTVSAFNSAGKSTFSNELFLTTPPAPVTTPIPPSNLSVGNATSSSLTLSWVDNSNNEEGFRVYRAPSQFGTYAEIATTTGSSYMNSGLSASTTYWYKVAAYNSADTSTQTVAASGTTLSLSAPPIAPTGLMVGSASSSSLTLSWNDNSNDELGFRIYRAASQFGSYSQIASTISTSYVDAGLASSSTYWYKVSAYSGIGESAQTSAVSGTTLAPPIINPSAPSNLVASNITKNSATLTWTNNASNESGFQIGTCSGLLSTGSDGSLACVGGFGSPGFVQVAQVGAGITSYNISGLNPNTEYKYFVRAFNSAGTSSNTGVSFTTDLQSTITITNNLTGGGSNRVLQLRIGTTAAIASSDSSELLSPDGQCIFLGPTEISPDGGSRSYDIAENIASVGYYVFIGLGIWDDSFCSTSYWEKKMWSIDRNFNTFWIYQIISIPSLSTYGKHVDLELNYSGRNLVINASSDGVSIGQINFVQTYSDPTTP